MQSEVTLCLLPPLPSHACICTCVPPLPKRAEPCCPLSALLLHLHSSSHPLLPAPAILPSPLHAQWFSFHRIIPIHKYFCPILSFTYYPIYSQTHPDSCLCAPSSFSPSLPDPVPAVFSSLHSTEIALSNLVTYTFLNPAVAFQSPSSLTC